MLAVEFVNSGGHLFRAPFAHGLFEETLFLG
jgi:hypothetical protein